MRLLLLIAFAACGSRDDSSTPNANVDESAAAEGRASEPARAETLELDPSPEPNIELVLSNQDGALALTLRSLSPTRLKRLVRVEKQSGEEWVLVDAPYALRADCDVESAGCIDLAAGAELAAPSIGPSEGQCGMDAGETLEPAHYRFVVESCAPEGTRPHQLRVEATLADPSATP